MSTPQDAISRALAIGDRPALLTLGHDAAVSGDAEGLARCLGGLGLEADAEVADAIVVAVAASNGRRRANLLAVKEVLSCAARARDGEATARYPWHEGLVWQKRTHERPFARAEGVDGGVRLTVGEEEISSYGTPHPVRVHLEVVLAAIEPPAPAAEAALGLRTVQHITSYLHPERRADMADALGASSLLAGVRHLTLTTEPGGLAMMLRACGDALGQLETLEVELSYIEHMRLYSKKAPDCSFTAEDVDALCALKLGALRTLRLGGILAGDAGERIAAALADAGAPLHTLSLRHSRMGNKALMAFARGGLLRGLSALDLHDVRCTGAGLAAITTTQPPESIEVLGLSKASVGKPVAQALADWSGLSTLRRFELTDARISAENKATLLASPHLIPTSLVSLP